MADGIGVGVVDAPINSGGATETAGAESSQAQEKVTSETGTEQAGGSQDSSEGGSVDSQGVRQRGPSKLDTIRELRAKVREQRSYWESEVGMLKQQLDEIRNQIASGQGGKKPSKTFWEDPEGILEEKMSSHLSELEKRMLSKIEQRQTLDQESSEWKSETSEATKFITTQKGLTPDDEEDIAEIVRSTPAMQNLRPMDRAKYALFLWKEERGVTDNSAKKARASTVIGAPPAGGGPKTWTESEIEKEMSKFPSNVANWTPDDETRFKKLDDEIRRAYREKRVTK